MPVALYEIGDTIFPEFWKDAISYATVGAELCASVQHRQLASAMECPVGFGEYTCRYPAPDRGGHRGGRSAQSGSGGSAVGSGLAPTATGVPTGTSTDADADAGTDAGTGESETQK